MAKSIEDKASMVAEKKMSNVRIDRFIKIGLCIVAGQYLWILFSAALINDDYMALYTTWRMSIGDVPGIDFNVDSYTLQFNLFSLIFKLIGDKIEVIYVFRLLMMLTLFGIIIQIKTILGTFVSRKIALVTIFLLLIALPMYSRGLDIRPDLLILLTWLQIVILLPKQSIHVNIKMVLIGVLIGIAYLLKFKSLIILLPIGMYLFYYCYKGLHISSLIRSALMICTGFLLALLAYTILFGVQELVKLLVSSTELLGLSASGGIKTPGLKLHVIKHFVKQDIYYWILFFTGIGIAVKDIRTYPSESILKITTIFLLLILSVALNPHYYAYNLITLYPLMAIFVALSIKWIAERMENMPQKKSAFYITAIVLILIQPIAGIASYPLRNSNEYQMKLHCFIQNNTTPDQAVFAYEGIGLFRPSTFHWRTSSIMLRNYFNGRYSVWQEISETKPILVILSYRLPKWLKKQDAKQLFRNYVPIAPYVMTLGVRTNSSIRATLMKSGFYQVLNSIGQSCELDGREVEDRSIIWLEAGKHTLNSPKGASTLRWYLRKESINQLLKSNPKRYPYLLPPT